jgi:lipopolysaccharide transport system ATP-binding protein
MSDLAIRMEGLSKRYRIGAQPVQYRTLRESLAGAATKPLRRWRDRAAREAVTTIWALKDISFEIRRGEAVGIIGRNGAGKSTLLKVLSRITAPTAGYAEIHGRVGSLLEVGTGFHAELTGRDNIYLNGAILGMKRSEIDRKFDEIVAFAEIDQFLDTPVKRYSSGMYVRLAFAVAAHLEPEILVVDEVLAVGDATFQKKCLGKMSDVARGGRTVLFVSHNIGAVIALCDRGVLLDHGQIQREGSALEVTEFYQSSVYATMADVSDLSAVEHYGTGKARFTALKLTPLSPDGRPRPYLQPGHDLQIDIDIRAVENLPSVNVCAVVYDPSGYRLIDVNTALQSAFLTLRTGQTAHVRFRVEQVLLKPGLYLLGLWMGRGGIEHVDGITYATSFTVEPDPEALVHTETFPGIYQCRFTHSIQVTD